MSAFPKKISSISQNFSHRPFSCFNLPFSLGEAKSVADVDKRGGPKSLHFANFTILSLFFLPRGGPNSIANFDGGPWPDLPPWIRHCVCKYVCYVCMPAYMNVYNYSI